MSLLIKIAMVMLGGSMGALCRYGFSMMAAKYMGPRFPWGTLLANMLGCFLIGVAFALGDRTSLFTPTARLFIMTGFLGALTTFSTYALETMNFMRTGSYVAVTNFLINNLGGCALVLAGFWVVELALKGGK